MRSQSLEDKGITLIHNLNVPYLENVSSYKADIG
jgi:hypothetical protein